MPILEKGYLDIFSDMRSMLLNTAPIGRYNRGAKARSFLDAISVELAKTFGDAQAAISQSQLRTSSGQSLDIIGDLFGVRRKMPSAAQTTADSNNVSVYVETGTFGDINNGLPIVIPAGTEVTTDSGISYRTTMSKTLQPGETLAHLGIIAVNAGSSTNRTAGEIVKINFNDYANSNLASLKVVNKFAVDGGSDEESDDNYRWRISQKLLSLEGCNTAFLRATALSVPGVRDVKLLWHENGIGTATVYVYGSYPEESVYLAREVKNKLMNAVAMGDYIDVKSPDIVKFSFTTTVNYYTSTRYSGETFIKTISAGEAASISTEAQSAVVDYFKGMSVDEPLYLDQVGAAILGASTSIKSLGSGVNMFDSVLIWRKLPNGEEYSRKFTDRSYEPAETEYITLKNVELTNG